MTRPDPLTVVLVLAALLGGSLAWRQADASGDLRRLTVALGLDGAPVAGMAPRDSGESGRALSPGAGNPAFTDVTASSGLTFVHERFARGEFWIPELLGAGGALLDADGDGDLDAYLVQGGPLDGVGPDPRNALFANDGSGRFAPWADGHGSDLGGHGMGAAAADVDADGDVDLFVTRVGPDVLLTNNGAGRFTDVTAAAGLGHPGYSTSAAFADLDLDGDLDLYVAHYLVWSPAREQPCYSLAGVRDYCHPATYPAEADALFTNDGQGVFTDGSVASGIAAAARPGLAVLTSDFDEDGRTDLYVANDQEPAFLWANQGDGTFLDTAMLAGCAFDGDGVAIAGMGLAAGDLDDDGDEDLLVTNILDQAHLGLRRDGALFTDRSPAWGLDGWSVPDTGWGLALFDQDHDGALDLYVANGHVNRLHEPRRPEDPFAQPDRFARLSDGHFQLAVATETPAVDTGRAVLRGDLDHDGDQDLIITGIGGPARVLRNDADAARAWTLIDIRGKNGTTAIGARVEVFVGSRRWTRVVRPHTGYLGTNDPRVHAGLGDAARIDRLVIRWPDGTVDEARDLPVRERLRVERRPSFSVAVLGAPR